MMKISTCPTRTHRELLLKMFYLFLRFIQRVDSFDEVVKDVDIKESGRYTVTKEMKDDIF